MALTPEAFLAFYPQFSSFAQGVVLPEYLRQANARFSDFGSDADEARRLYTAHKLTLYSASCLPEGVTTPTKSQIASAGKGSMQEIASKKVGDVSISYATSTSTSNGNSTGLCSSSACFASTASHGIFREKCILTLFYTQQGMRVAANVCYFF